MEVLIGGVAYSVGSRIEHMIRLLAQHSEIENEEYGHVSFNFHSREVLMELRVIRERVQLPHESRRVRVA